MTPTQIETLARQKYNATGDTFYSQDEILGYMYEGCVDLCRDNFLIEATYTTSTVADQQQYSYPTNTIAIKRVTYDGKKLKQMTMREDDAITGLNQSTTATGTPQYYFVWDEVLYLRPIPSSVANLVIYSFNEPSTLTINSTLEIPTVFHASLVNFIVSEMAAKDSNFGAAQFYLNKWEKTKLEAKKFARKKLRGDSFATVQDEDMMIEGYLGIV